MHEHLVAHILELSTQGPIDLGAYWVLILGMLRGNFRGIIARVMRLFLPISFRPMRLGETKPIRETPRLF